MCRHTPAATSAGNSQVPNAQNSTEAPATRCRVASTAGALAIFTISAPATTVIAVAPIETQYGGVTSCGLSPKCSILAARNAARNASAARPVCTVGSSVADSTATDWVATAQMNQVPLTLASTGSRWPPSVASHGIT